MKRLATVLLIALSVAACSARDTAPPGFVDACYGGRERMARNWVMSDDRMQLVVEAAESEWPLLKRMVTEAGQKAGFRVFDTSSNIPGYIRTVEVSVCDDSGIFLSLDKRVYLREEVVRSGPPPDDKVVTVLRTYHRSAQWEPLAKEVLEQFRAHFKEQIEVKYPPLRNQTLSKLSLPDSLRAELEVECRAAKAGERAYYCDP